MRPRSSSSRREVALAAAFGAASSVRTQQTRTAKRMAIRATLSALRAFLGEGRR